ncbi:MAG TPA: hypothetical protein VMP68_32225 [Candidatus Eisenbacteria bacterium]|nr:hypothetical protein [Candidatus Eisenbacteria bacterium]
MSRELIETQRVHVEDGVWRVQCPVCHRWFEAKRADATFDTARCRKWYNDAPKRKKHALEELHSMAIRASEIAHTYRYSQDVFDQILALRAALKKTLEGMDTDWSQERLL